MKKALTILGLIAGVIGGQSLFGAATLAALPATAAGIVQVRHPAPSIWSMMANSGETPNIFSDMIPSFMKDCSSTEAQRANALLPNIELCDPETLTNDERVRIATYNVHNWGNPLHGWSNSLNEEEYKKIIAVIERVNADILVLQEVRLPNEGKQVYADLANLGYCHTTFGCIGDGRGHTRGKVGTLIASRYPLQSVDDVPFADQAADKHMRYTHVTINLPSGERLSLYGTYLINQLWDEQYRVQEVEQILKATRADTCPNKVMFADFNTVRPEDYQYDVANGMTAWTLMQQNDDDFVKSRGQKMEVALGSALGMLKTAGWQDSFAQAGVSGPKYTTWSGRTVDYIFCGPQFGLNVLGSYVYYNAASDHLPVIMDIAIIPGSTSSGNNVLASAVGDVRLRPGERLSTLQERQNQLTQRIKKTLSCAAVLGAGAAAVLAYKRRPRAAVAAAGASALAWLKSSTLSNWIARWWVG